MHSVTRSPEPDFFAEIRASRSRWDDLTSSDRIRIRQALEQDFGRVCAYCERLCQPPTQYGPSINDATIDHFRPRSLCSSLWLDWLNMMYACRRCNTIKGSNWPRYDDATNSILATTEPRYIPVTEYVNPNTVQGAIPAHDFFNYDVATGEIAPSNQVPQIERSIARRTIADLDLNDSDLGENDPNHLWNQRLEQLDFVSEKLNELDDFDLKVQMMLEFMLPDKPFSGFIFAYYTRRFPALIQLTSLR